MFKKLFPPIHPTIKAIVKELDPDSFDWKVIDYRFRVWEISLCNYIVAVNRFFDLEYIALKVSGKEIPLTGKEKRILNRVLNKLETRWRSKNYYKARALLDMRGKSVSKRGWVRTDKSDKVNYKVSIDDPIDLPKENEVTINIAKDFSKSPAGKLYKNGEFSAERFREEYLVPALLDEGNASVKVVLDGLEGVGWFWWRDVFGGLVRYHDMYDLMRKKMNITCEDDKTLHQLIYNITEEANKKTKRLGIMLGGAAKSRAPKKRKSIIASKAPRRIPIV